METYLKEHGLTPKVIEKYGLKIGADQIEIPVFDREGKKLFSKYRVFNQEMKYRYEKGSKMALYNAHRITDATKKVFIVEGEFDAIALHEHFGSRAPHCAVVSSTGGAGTWNEEWTPLLFGKEVMILLDNDNPGREGACRIWEKIGANHADVHIVIVTERYKDVCEMLNAVNRISYFISIPSEMGYFMIHHAKVREKMRIIKGYLGRLNEREMSSFRPDDKAMIRTMRDYLAKIWERDRPRRKPVESKLTGNDIADIKRVPITNYVRFHGGVAKCIFHSDKNPSMYYNDEKSQFPNTVKCYSCGKFGDVIDVVMALNQVGFKEAVKIIKGV